MRVTPLDIRKQEFRKVMRGLDSEEVYAFLQTVADEYEAVLSDNKNLRERMVELEDRLKEYKNIEMNLRNTLLTAEKITAEAKENARREASLIVREAEVEAEKAAEMIRAHTMQLRREILELKKQKDNYITRLKTLLESHRKVLEGFEEDFSEVDRAIDQIGEQVEMDIKEAVKPPRMSREKITEDTVMGPRDKVTWGDERRREDEPRPSMPKPDRHGKQDHERGEASPEDSSEASTEHEAKAPSASMEKELSPVSAEARTASDSEDVLPHLGTKPIGAFNEKTDTRMGGDVRAETPRDQREITEMESGRDNGAARRIVEQSVSERMYSETRTEDSGQHASRAAERGASPRDSREPWGTQAPHAVPTDQAFRQEGKAPHAGSQAAGRGTQANTSGQGVMGTAVMEAEASSEQTTRMPETPDAGNQPGAAGQVELKATQDNWKHYEVKDQKPDWTQYEVPRSRSELEKQAAPPNDKEVEEALAGLKDMSAAKGHETGGTELPRDMKTGDSPAAGEQPITEAENQPALAAENQPTPEADEQPETAAGEQPMPTSDEQLESTMAQAFPKQTEWPTAQAPIEAPTQRMEMPAAAQPPKQEKETPPPAQPPVQEGEMDAAVQPPAHAPGSGSQQETTGVAEDDIPRTGEEPVAEELDDGKRNSFWSMDQLRKNLSNFIGREEEGNEERDEAREE